ncbi:MAG TPA: hypothetical protein VF885_25165 [Arthrobacter sp.]
MIVNVTALSPLFAQKDELARLTELATNATEALALYRAGEHDLALASEFQHRIDSTLGQAAEVAVMIALTEGAGSETAVAAFAA